MRGEIKLNKKIDILFSEWRYLQDSSAWNFDIIEKQRNYGFIFVATIFGVTKASILDQQTQLWLLVPPMVVILLTRITTQLEFIGVRLNRILDIEERVSELFGDSEILTTESMFASNKQSTSVYAITYIYIYLFFYSVLAYSLYRSALFLGSQSVILPWCYVGLFVVTVVFPLYRHASYTVTRYRKKQEVKTRIEKETEKKN